MSLFSGRQGRGAMRKHRAKKQLEAQIRQEAYDESKNLDQELKDVV